jgi:RNA polymerase sigma factor (sigma-70 family)
MVLRLVKSVYEDDEVLLLAIRNQEEDAYKFLYERLYPSTERYVVNNGGSQEDAKDIFQECLMILTEKIHRNLHLTSALSTFFYSVVKHHWSKKLLYKGRISNLIPEHTIEDDDTDTLIEENNAITMRMLEAIKNLGERCQEILSLYYWQRHSMKEIAEKLNYSNADNAKNQKHKCLNQIRKSITK